MPLTKQEKLLFETIEEKNQISRAEKLKLLLPKLQADTLNAKNYHGKSPLMICVEDEDYECAQLLIEANVDPNDHDLQHNSVSMTAVLKGDPNVIKLLIRANANMSYGTPYFTPLQIAVEKENFIAIELLLENLVTIRDVSELCRLLASRKKFDLMNLFLKNYPMHKHDLIHHVILYKLNEFTLTLLKDCADNIFRFAVDCAMHSNNIELIRTLLTRVIFLKKTQVEELLYFAAKLNDPELVDQLIRVNVDVNFERSYDNALHVAVQTGGLATVKLLLDAKAIVNKKSRLGTALFAAIQKSEIEIVQTLLEAKANPNQAVSEYQYGLLSGCELPPLYWAAKIGNLAMVRTLLQHNANVNNIEMPRIFRVAAEYGHIETVLFLIQQKPNCEKVDLNFENYLTKTFDLSKRRAECIALIQNYLLDKQTPTMQSSWLSKVRHVFQQPIPEEVDAEEEKVLMVKK